MAVLVGKKAPNFKAPAILDGERIVEDFSLDQYLGKKYVVLFFYPKDFTFVCPTELHAFQQKLNEFEKRNTQLIACSTDTEFSHWGWLQVSKEKGGIRGITYPLVADTNKTISFDYDVLAGELSVDENNNLITEGELVAYRGLFIIDKEGIVRQQTINDMPLGRSVDETLRLVDAVQFAEEYGEVCPANWNKGEKGMSATQEGLTEYFQVNQN